MQQGAVKSNQTTSFMQATRVGVKFRSLTVLAKCFDTQTRCQENTM